MSAPPDPYQTVVAITRLETKMDMVLTVQASHTTDLEALKARRWPLSVTTVLMSVVGCAGGIVTLLHK